QPVKDYFAGVRARGELPTVDGLLEALLGQAGTLDDLNLALGPGLDLSVVNGVLTVDFAFAAERTTQVALGIGTGSAEAGLKLNADVDVDLVTRFQFDATFGVDLAELTADPRSFGDAFFVRINAPPTVSAQILGDGPALSFGASLGFLGVQGQVQGLPVNA